jgi:hypothetical protein
MSLRTENEHVGPMEAASAEHRRHARFPLTALVEALEPKSNTQITGRSSDVSLGGCYVDTLNPFSEGTLIRVRLTRENISFEANAKVMYSQIGMGMGIAFTSAEKDQFRVFQKWIAELTGPSTTELNVQGEKPKGGGNTGSQGEQTYVLNELVIALMRKGVLTEVEGQAMLKMLHR